MQKKSMGINECILESRQGFTSKTNSESKQEVPSEARSRTETDGSQEGFSRDILRATDWVPMGSGVQGIGVTQCDISVFSTMDGKGVFKAMWQRGLQQYDELCGIDWEWQSIDGSMSKAPMVPESVGPDPTDRGKTKRHVLVDGRGVPLSVVLTGAHVNDVSKLESVLR